MVLKFKKKHSSLFIQHLLRICSTEACFSIVMYDNHSVLVLHTCHLHILFSILSLSSHIANLPTSLIDLFLLCISPLLFPSPQSKPYSRSSSPCAYREERGFDLPLQPLKHTGPLLVYKLPLSKLEKDSPFRGTQPLRHSFTPSVEW